MACKLDRKLEYSDRVKIVYNEEPCPKFDWLRFVKTEAARNALIDYYSKVIAE